MMTGARLMPSSTSCGWSVWRLALIKAVTALTDWRALSRGEGLVPSSLHHHCVTQHGASQGTLRPPACLLICGNNKITNGIEPAVPKCRVNRNKNSDSNDSNDSNAKIFITVKTMTQKFALLIILLVIKVIQRPMTNLFVL